VSLAWRELGPEAGGGRPVVLIHGLFSNAATNWIRYGHASLLAAAGFRVVMPDLRAHGSSAAPHDPAAYPPDILADDGFALLATLGLEDGGYDLGGYSLGGRTVVRMLARGARPGRAIVAGMGLQGLLDTGARSDHFRHVINGIGTHPRGSPEFMAEAFLKTTGADPAALLPLLGSFVDTPPAALAGIATPTLVACGIDDADNGSAEALAGALGDGRYVAVPGNHMSAVVKPELGRAIADFLTGAV
jgi:pimeloyl-ACP methyl ester carboxylesterase